MKSIKYSYGIVIISLSALLSYGIILHSKYRKNIIESKNSIDSTNSNKINIEKKDPEVMTVQDVDAKGNDEYRLTTTGWNHGNIVYISIKDGSFEYISEVKKEEKEKSDEKLTSIDFKKLNELRNK